MTTKLHFLASQRTPTGTKPVQAGKGGRCEEGKGGIRIFQEGVPEAPKVDLSSFFMINIIFFCNGLVF